MFIIMKMKEIIKHQIGIFIKMNKTYKQEHQILLHPRYHQLGSEVNSA